MSVPEPSARGVENRSFPTDAEDADRVFITPRVLDQGAFREYADSLKGLIREAGGRRTELRTDAEEARQLSENLGEAADRLRERLETTAKLLPVLDNRVKRAEQAIARAEEGVNLPATLEERIGRHITAMEERVKGAMDAADQRLAAIESRYRELKEQAEADLTRLERIGAEMSRSADLAAEALNAAVERTTALRAEIDGMAADAGARVSAGAEKEAARADQMYAALRQSVSGVLAEADGRVAEIEAQIAPFLARAESIPGSMREHARRTIEAIDAHAEQAMKRARAVEMLNERAVRLLGFDPDDPADEVSPDSLMMLVQNGDALERQARATASELAALHAANDGMCERLTAAARDSEVTGMGLERRRDELVASIERSMAAMASGEADYLERVVRTRNDLAEIEQRRAQVELGMGDISGELAALERGVAEQLGVLRARASEELSVLSEAVAAQRRSLGLTLGDACDTGGAGDAGGA